MSKKEIVYVCSECGEEFSKWSGVCSSCQAWNTIREIRLDKNANLSKDIEEAKVLCLRDLPSAQFQRIKINIREIDQVLGGGIVPGSVILLGGDPGIGKSTILAQVINNISNSLYASGEESPEQLKIRIERLGLDLANFNVISETDIDCVVKTIYKIKPKLAVIDSIQTMYSRDFPSTPGSLVQVRECALKLQNTAKKLHIPIILIGHVTKEGSIAGPKILEHLVDVVLYLEGERFHNNRILRGVKNRFGEISEIGIFEMTERGLKEVDNPSKLFLEEKSNNVSGNVVTATLEGNRPILVEIQSLIHKSVFGYPRRTVSGFDLNRLNLLLAILAKRAKIYLDKYDVFVNVVGGLKVKDPACDLAVVLALASAYYNKKIDSELCAFGELGLTGEIRRVKLDKKRINEAKKLGFNKIVTEKFLDKAINNLFKK